MLKTRFGRGRAENDLLSWLVALALGREKVYLL